MGSLVNATCQSCGYERRFTFGAGFKDFQTVSRVPAIDGDSGKFAIKNYLKKDTFRKHYDFYNDPSMSKCTTEEADLQWGDVYLKPTDNYCPDGKQFTLSFQEYACWD